MRMAYTVAIEHMLEAAASEVHAVGGKVVISNDPTTDGYRAITTAADVMPSATEVQ